MNSRPDRKIEKSKNAASVNSVSLCSFGFELKPRCGRRPVKLDLSKIPDFRRLMKNGAILQKYCTFINERTALLDQCLACHIERGYTLQDFKTRFKNREI
jgi:hypothetical protein